MHREVLVNRAADEATKERAALQAHLKDLRRQLDVKDTQIATLLERIKEANAIHIQQRRQIAPDD